MATKHTTNYQLNLWEPNDAFVRTEFNENSNKIDAALGILSTTVAEHTAAVSAHAASLSTVSTALAGKIQLATGTYKGNGSATSRYIYFGVPAKAVIITASFGLPLFTVLIRGQTEAGPAMLSNGNQGFKVEWGDMSVTFTANTDTTTDRTILNETMLTYHWCAFY